ncbi:hypothetical protein SO802_012975 [Lithocarpus litseifolius]|uniref:Uncharacterized protein n=1 Tax=Lithocarpus litseifolius TaxID=425828 RepID=A0AAW2D540_9ROSI
MCNVCILCCSRSPVRGQWKRSKILIQARKEPRRGLNSEGSETVKVALTRVESKVDMVSRSMLKQADILDLEFDVLCNGCHFDIEVSPLTILFHPVLP